MRYSLGYITGGIVGNTLSTDEAMDQANAGEKVAFCDEWRKLLWILNAAVDMV